MINDAAITTNKRGTQSERCRGPAGTWVDPETAYQSTQKLQNGRQNCKKLRENKEKKKKKKKKRRRQRKRRRITNEVSK